jgi:acyl carrier protein
MVTAGEVLAFAIKSLEEMNYKAKDVGTDTMIGPTGVDLDSLAFTELVARFEDHFGASFPDDEVEQLAIMTLGEIADTVAERAVNLVR